MKVQEYRDLTEQMLRLVDDYSSCVGDGEKAAWERRVAPIYDEFVVITCPRATSRDVEFHDLAIEGYKIIMGKQPSHQFSGFLKAVAQRTSGNSLAFNRNKSPGRAVRLARAARSAMRRGYF